MSAHRTVLITGSSDPQAMGWAAGLALARAPHNYRVILSGRNPESLQASVDALRERLKAEGTQQAEIDVRSLVLDVSDGESIKAAVAQLGSDALLGKEGVLDCLINNAGLGAPPGRSGKGTTTMFLPTHEATAEDILTVMLTNVAAVVELTNQLLPFLARAQSPRIVNVSSARGSVAFASSLPPARTGSLVYNISKSALNMVTVMQAKNLPEHIGKPNLKVNAVSPGHVATAFNNFTGARTIDAGVAAYVYLATLGDDAPTGQLIGDHAPFAKADGDFVQIPW
ncbi:hypothetical protein V8E36_004103 [Tilletia maclaganii]